MWDAGILEFVWMTSLKMFAESAWSGAMGLLLRAVAVLLVLLCSPNVVWRCDYKVMPGTVSLIVAQTSNTSTWRWILLPHLCSDQLYHDVSSVMCLHSPQNINIKDHDFVTGTKRRSSKWWSWPNLYANVSIKPSLNHEWSEKNIMDGIKETFSLALGRNECFNDFIDL